VFPQQGECLLDGIDVSKRLPSTLERTFFIAEEVNVPSLTPKQFVANTAGFYPRFNPDEFYQTLKGFDIPDDVKMDKLSYGQQKKAMIAFSLAANTDLLIMDEPTNGLDIPSKAQFRKIIASALTEDRCIVISTHQVRDLDMLIDTMVVLHEQEIILNQSMDEIAEKLSFKTLQDTSGYEPLYVEESIRGKNVILLNNSTEYGKVDIEMLFTALLSNNQTLLNHLNAAPYEQSI
jgi:ABC-2 type transport system ATP-binding protein